MRASKTAAALLLLQQLCKKKSTFPAIQEFSWAQHCPSRGLRKIWTKLHSTSLRSRVLSGSKIRYNNQGIILAHDLFWSPRVQGEYAMQTTKTRSIKSGEEEATEATATVQQQRQQHHRRSKVGGGSKGDVTDFDDTSQKLRQKSLQKFRWFFWSIW